MFKGDGVTDSDLFLKYIDVCDLHVRRLEDALSHIQSLLPLTENVFPLKSYEDIASLDMFSMRLSKLQDTMGSKLIPLFLNIMGEKTDGLSVIDMLNKLQKLLIVDDIKIWKQLRDVRNIISHEYPDSYDVMAETLNKAIELYPYLFSILNKIKKKAEKCPQD